MQPVNNTYQAKVGCWNCNNVFEIPVKFGTNTPEFIVKKKPKCARCGCVSLRMFAEYVAEKKIMKDILLHDRIEHMDEVMSKPNKNHEHYK